MNEFKFSTLRQFGSENVSFTATIQSEKTLLTQEEIDGQIDQIDKLISKAFRQCEERAINEKSVLVEFSGKRKEEVAKLDQALKEEMTTKQEAARTMNQAEKLSKKLSK